MTIQTVGRVGAQGDGVYDFLARAAVTGGARTGSVGRDIMLDAINLSPGRYFMADPAGHAIGQVTNAEGNGMDISEV